jgi:hypothetical protein
MIRNVMEYIQIIREKETNKDGQKSRTTVTIDAEDIVAIGAVVVALAVVGAMIWGALPINKFTVGLASLSGAAAPIAQIIKARDKAPKRTPWIAWIIIVVLVVAFGLYAWATWGALAALFK